MVERNALSWGRYPRVKQKLIGINDRRKALPAGVGEMLPRGYGRSYGDSCLNDGGSLLMCRGLDRFIDFNSTTGVLSCEAGVLFAEILDLVTPQGWFLPVTPGTKYVTVGGAIANDVHGKNHHLFGSMGHHLIGFELLRSDGSRRYCAPDNNESLFSATVGGLGLTGVITWARLQLRRIPGPWMSTESIRFNDLDGFFDLSEASEQDYEYTVAWIDCAATGAALGRGIFSRANHAPAHPDTRPPPPQRRPGVPFAPPLSLVNELTLRAFNQLYFHRQKPGISRATVHFDTFFYPLDRIEQWNRLYGPRGFLQYQCVIPPAAARCVLKLLLQDISNSGQGSFLAVLKQFGNIDSVGMLSFARPGITLALDFPNRGTSTMTLLNRLDEHVARVGGAVYPAKDARMSGQHFRNYFGTWESFSTFIDPKMSSSLWRRVMV